MAKTVGQQLSQFQADVAENLVNLAPGQPSPTTDPAFAELRLMIGPDILGLPESSLTAAQKTHLKKTYYDFNTKMREQFRRNQKLNQFFPDLPNPSDLSHSVRQPVAGYGLSSAAVPAASDRNHQPQTVYYGPSFCSSSGLWDMYLATSIINNIGYGGSYGSSSGDGEAMLVFFLVIGWFLAWLWAWNLIDESSLHPELKLFLQSVVVVVGVGAPLGLIIYEMLTPAAPAAATAAKASAHTAAQTAGAWTLLAIVKVVSFALDIVLFAPYVLNKMYKDIRNISQGYKLDKSWRRLIMAFVGIAGGLVLGFLIPVGGPFTAVAFAIGFAWCAQKLSKLWAQHGKKSSNKGSQSDLENYQKMAQQIGFNEKVAKVIAVEMQQCTNPDKYRLLSHELALYSEGNQVNLIELLTTLEIIARGEKIASRKDQNGFWGAADLLYGFHDANKNREAAVEAIRLIKAGPNSSVINNPLTAALRKLGIKIKDDYSIATTVSARGDADDRGVVSGDQWSVGGAYSEQPPMYQAVDSQHANRPPDRSSLVGSYQPSPSVATVANADYSCMV